MITCALVTWSVSQPATADGVLAEAVAVAGWQPAMTGPADEDGGAGNAQQGDGGGEGDDDADGAGAHGRSRLGTATTAEAGARLKSAVDTLGLPWRDAVVRGRDGVGRSRLGPPGADGGQAQRDGAGLDQTHGLATLGL